MEQTLINHYNKKDSSYIVNTYMPTINLFCEFYHELSHLLECNYIFDIYAVYCWVWTIVIIKWVLIIKIKGIKRMERMSHFLYTFFCFKNSSKTNF